jgi:CubicO group peptidase (beta-lactamase class C family)
MRDNGLIDSLDDPLSKYNPDFSIKNPYNVNRKDITWRQVASHMAGLPRECPCPSDNNCSVTTEEVLKSLASETLILMPGTKPSYSNLGYGLIGT